MKHSQTMNYTSNNHGRSSTCRTVNLWARDAQDDRRAVGTSAHHRGQHTLAARAAAAARFRRPSLAQPLRLLTAVPVRPPPCAHADAAPHRHQDGGGGGAGGACGVRQTIRRSQIFARLRRAIFRAPAACAAMHEASQEVAMAAAKRVFCVFPVGRTVAWGVKSGQIFYCMNR